VNTQSPPARKGEGAPVGEQQLGELRHERNAPICRGRLGRDTAGGNAAVRPRELRAHVDHAGREVDVLPDQAEQLRDAHPAVDGGGEQRPVARQARGQQPPDLVPAQHPLAPADGVRPLAGLELAHSIVDRPAVAEREA
jgi:hypothetical protein